MESRYPDRSYENFQRLDTEVMRLGMTEGEVVKLLGAPDRRTVYPEAVDEKLVYMWYRLTTDQDFYAPGKAAAPIEYLLWVEDGAVVNKRFWSGY